MITRIIGDDDDDDDRDDDDFDDNDGGDVGDEDDDDEDDGGDDHDDDHDHDENDGDDHDGDVMVVMLMTMMRNTLVNPSALWVDPQRKTDRIAATGDNIQEHEAGNCGQSLSTQRHATADVESDVQCQLVVRGKGFLPKHRKETFTFYRYKRLCWEFQSRGALSSGRQFLQWFLL